MMKVNDILKRIDKLACKPKLFGCRALGAVIVGVALAASYPVSATAAGDVAAGKAKSSMCAGCHGSDGNSTVPNFPKLAGQNEKYIVKQLKDLQSGERQIPEMAAMVENMSEQSMNDIAAYYASQTGVIEGADPALKEKGESIYRAGNSETGVVACSACHGAKGGGLASAGFPRLSGQHAAYIEAQLRSFRAAGRDDSTGKRRTNDGDTQMMRSVAAKMSDKEIEAVSSYISGLH